MADVAARREARRKRILENSENRLRMISGAVTSDDPEPSPMSVSDASSSLPRLDQAELNKSSQPKPVDISNHSKAHNVPRDVVEKLVPSTEQDDTSTEPFTTFDNRQSNKVQQSEETSSVLATILASRLHLVALAILVRLLFSSNYSNLFPESIFVPLFSVTLVKYIGILPDPGNAPTNGGIFNAALMLSGLPAWQIGLLKSSLGVLTNFIFDFNVYFFSFIVLHVMLELIIW